MSRHPAVADAQNTAGPSSAPSSPPQPADVAQQQSLRRPASHGRLNKLMIPGRSRGGSNASEASLTLPRDEEPSSGRSTPELRRRAGKAAAASLLASDAKYRKFAQLVDRSLQSFESVNEWADFISFLSRLLKTLQSPSPPYGEIPRKLVVAKRLAQCLNPALPSGVHQRALDVYAYIFSIIGVDGLKRDLLIWSSGLFPFFQYAATSVRPLLISIYERFYLPLGQDLRPATKALILALLPGIEEETGDFFDKVLSLLDKLSEAVTPSFFLPNIFLILISTSSARLSALNYLSRRVLKPPDNADSGLLIRGVAAVLDDENVLVRRNGLDLLLRILPLDGQIFQDAKMKDKELLVRATGAVVLQRELSLSRRVYSWLLGSGETSSDQLEYFKQHGLDLLVKTLHHDMATSRATTETVDVQRPFKVFLSLLDKWEIGSLLSERLAVPALETIKSNVSWSTDVAREEALATASAVYEAVEPTVIWKSLYATVVQDLRAEPSHAIDLVQWLIAAIPQHDEEINSVHIPILINAVLETTTVSGTTPSLCVLPNNAQTTPLTPELRLSALRLVNALLALIPPTTWNKASASPVESSSDEQAISWLLYSDTSQVDKVVQRISSQILPRIVQISFGVCQTALVNHHKQIECLLEAIGLVSLLIDLEIPTLISIDGASWLSNLIIGLEKVTSFAVVEALVVAALKASRCPTFSPPVEVTSDTTISALLDSLFRYLRPDASPYHARAVELLWDYNRLAEIYTLENVIARRMASAPFNSSAFEAFGIFWRLTDDSMLPGEIFHIPISHVLDALKSTDPEVQRHAETWMRCNLRSYFRVVDPLITRLLDPRIRYDAGRYANPIDLSLVRHQLESISSIFKFGGQGLSKACQATELRHSLHPSLNVRAETQFPNAVTYLEVLVLLLLRFIETEAPQSSQMTATPLVIRVQAAALELLQTIVSRGDVSHALLGNINAVLVDKLRSAVHDHRLTLQSKMLHLLHSGINAASAFKGRNHRRTASSIETNSVHTNPAELETSLVRTIIDGVSTPHNMPVLQHWIDFVLMTVGQFRTQPGLLYALSECFSQRTRLLVLQLDNVYGIASIYDDPCTVTDSEVIMLLNALERILVFLAQTPGRGSEDTSKPPESGSSILGLVSNVFTVEAPANDVAKSDSPRYLDDAVHALLLTWAMTSNTKLSNRAQTSTFENIRLRNGYVLEKVFKAQAWAVVASCMHVWSMGSKHVTDAAIFECIDTLTPSAQNAAELVCDIVSGKTARASISDYRTDPAYLSFLAAYLTRLEAPIAVQVWTTLFNFAKEVVGAVASAPGKLLLFPTLRCLTVLALTVARTSALEDRRLRRDLQDTYTKVLDQVVNHSARIAESGLWERGVGVSEFNFEKGDTAAAIDKIYDYITAYVIPNLRTFLVDVDRVNAACSGMAITIVSPAFRRQDVDPSILRLLLEITKIPSTVKIWRIQIGETFSDPRFFKLKSEQELVYWKLLVCALMDSDKERFGELLGRITSASSANIFANREQEMLVKSHNLRRLSFILLSAERNYYLTQLPGIQERLVEMLRSNAVTPRVHSEVYLCLRVLLCRISPQHLSNFWPVILSELLRIFELTMDDPPENGSEQLQLILAACKFLDLLLVIQSEDFQIHQWMFVTDTTDAANPPEEYDPDAIMDRLAEIISQHHDHEISTPEKKSLALETQTPLQSGSGLRRPKLDRLRHLDSIRQLQDFFSHASIDTFENVYSTANSSFGAGSSAIVAVDWDAVEQSLTREIFDL